MKHAKLQNALYDIRDAILLAREFIEGYHFEQFRTDRKTFHAVTRMLEIISEASRRLSAEVRDRHPELPWRDIRDAGNFYRHQYDNVAEIYVWNTVEVMLSPLLAAIEVEIAREDRDM